MDDRMWPTVERVEALNVACPYCHAEPMRPCTTRPRLRSLWRPADGYVWHSHANSATRCASTRKVPPPLDSDDLLHRVDQARWQEIGMMSVEISTIFGNIGEVE